MGLKGVLLFCFSEMGRYWFKSQLASFSATKCRVAPQSLLRLMQVKTRMHSGRMRTVRSSGHLTGGGGGLLRGGCLLKGGVYSGGYLLLGGGGFCSGGCLLGGCLLERSAPGGGRGVCSWGVCVSQHALRQTPRHGQTDTCKSITFATSLRTVINYSVNLSRLLNTGN